MLVQIRVLMVSPKLDFVIRMKKTLEGMGLFDVAVATDAKNAIEQVRQIGHHVALIDFNVPDMPGEDLILRVRSLHPEMAIIAGPDRPDVRQVVIDLNLQAVIDLPCSSRTLVPLLKESIHQITETMPDTAPGKPVEPKPAKPASPQTQPEEPQAAESKPKPSKESHTLEFVVRDDERGLKLERKPQGSDQFFAEADEAVEIFKKLAAEEPPVPSLEESGTVRDLKQSMLDTDVDKVIDIFGDEDDEEDTASAEDHEDSQSVPLMVLEASQDDTTPLEAFSVDELLSNIQEQLPPGVSIQPLPSWLKESERYTHEPDFLPDELPELNQTSEYSSSTTQASSSQQLLDSDSLETDIISPRAKSQPAPPPDVLPEMPGERLNEIAESVESVEAPGEEAATEDVELVEESVDKRSTEDLPQPAELAIRDEAVELLPDTSDAEVESEELAPKAQPPYRGVEVDDPEIAQLAVVLTQTSLESTAEATLLARGGELVAYAGKLPIEEIEEIREAVADDWEADDGQSRIRFITITSSGTDYMLFSRRTLDDFTLSMIFSGTMPLRVIRRQSKRLLEALESVPEIPDFEQETVSEEEIAGAEPVPEARQEEPDSAVTVSEPVDAGPLTAYTYVWLLRDAEGELSDTVRQSIVLGLEEYLTQRYWQINQLEVLEDYVYLRADVPGEESPRTIIRDLMAHSAEIAVFVDPDLQGESLWNSSYLVLQPGREMDIEELQRFINFSRS